MGSARQCRTRRDRRDTSATRSTHDRRAHTQELQIALLLAGGKTTRETAAALFLSPKTIEYHLRHVYLKLDINSREQLNRTFASQPPHAGEQTAPTRTGTPHA